MPDPLNAEPDGFALIIAGEHDVFLAQQRATDFARSLGFNRIRVYRLATVVSELCTNLVFHADAGGSFTLSLCRDAGRLGIEIRAEDTGPGIPDLDLAMTDGYSTIGSLGGGLPGSRRLMDEFEIDARPGSGTRVVARLWS